MAEEDILDKINDILSDSTDSKFKELKDKISNSTNSSELVAFARDLQLNSGNWDCKQTEELTKLIEKGLAKLQKGKE